MNANMHAVREGELLWTPTPEFVERSNMAAFMRWLARERGQSFSTYEELRQWSVRDLDGFWSSIWDYFSILSDTPYQRVLNSTGMPGARWFEGSRVNYAEHLLRYEADAGADEVALYHCSEHRPLSTMTWRELGRQARIVATQLREMGVNPGDRVVSYMPNVPETAIAMMATTAIGAVWSSSAPEFGVKTVIDRFAQIAPKVLFAADGYRFAGREFRRESEVRQIVSALPSLEHVVWLPFDQSQTPAPDTQDVVLWSHLLDHSNVPREDFHFERVPFDHPLWIVFSSGTTGLPKPIVHSHVGVLVEHLKIMHFHINLKPGGVMLFYSTTGWMMWNILLSALLTGAAAVLYDGSPIHPNADFLWHLSAATRATCFGASPTFVQIMEKSGLQPGEKHDLSRLESVIVSGAPSTPETFAWFYRCVKADMWVTSQSGGTELCSGFVGGSPLLPVYAGEIQARLLGMDVHSWSDSGEELDDAIGELVVAKPFPSMPIYFWNDDGHRRYFESYFETFQGRLASWRFHPHQRSRRLLHLWALGLYAQSPRGAYWHCRDLPRGRKDSRSRGQSDRVLRAARRQLLHAAILGSEGRRTP
jgi:acetoacetyl-CoA synthetase